MSTVGLGIVKLRTDATPEQLLKDLALSPLIYLRVVGILFSIIVFGCMADKGFFKGPENTCNLNSSGACNFALTIAVLAFIICLVFFVKDVMLVILDFSESILIKKVVIIVDMAVTGLWTFFWFVAFCYTADQLRKTDFKLNTSTRNCMNSTVAFSFFSILLWIAIIVVNGLFLFWIIKGTDRDSKPSNNSEYPAGDDSYYDDKVDEITPEPSVPSTDPQYTPPDY